MQHSALSFHAKVATPFAVIGVRTEGDAVAELVFLPGSVKPSPPKNKLSELAVKQIQRYVADPDFCFDLPMHEVGTAFQRKVWKAIAGIPRGRVCTYGEIARQLRTAPRAIGQACGANWYPLVIPCHRVTASGGLGGFAHQDEGDMLGIKRWLLVHEGASLL